jgi:hypothetical protein
MWIIVGGVAAAIAQDAPAPEMGISADTDAAWKALYGTAVVLLDDRRADAERVAAAEALGQRGDARAVPLLRAASREGTAAVQIAAVRAVMKYPGAEAVDVARMLLLDREREASVQDAAIEVLSAVKLPEAGEALWSLAGAAGVRDRVRAGARRALEEHYPEVLASQGPPRTVSDVWGATAGVAAQGVLGGVLLGSVGTWGAFEGGTEIGAVGGALIGVSTGTLYAVKRPVTRGQGLAYASGVGWGLTGGVLAANAAFGPRDWIRNSADQRRRERFAPALWSIGSAAGAAVAATRLAHDPQPADVLEADLAGYLGSALVLSAVDIASGPPPVYVPPDAFVDEEASWNAYSDQRRNLGRRRSAAALAGAASGFGAGVLLSKRWTLDPEDALFASVVGAEAAWVGTFAPDALGINPDLRGTLRLPLHAAVAGALAYAEWHPVTPKQSAVAAFGALTGNAIGASIPLLAGYGEDTVARSMLPVGIFGMGLGLGAADTLATTPGDWTMVAVGTPIASAQGVALGVFLEDRGVLDTEQAAGVALAAGGGVGAGLLTLGKWVEPKPEDALFVGACGVWGGWYGTMIPIAADARMEGAEIAVSGSLVADAFMVAGGVLTAKDRLDPGRTLIPQTAGLTGATVGALGAAMFSRDGNDVALGAVVGSAVGIGGGALAMQWLGPKADDFAFRAPHLDLPGQWLPSAGPYVGEDGRAGLSLGLTGTGW